MDLKVLLVSASIAASAAFAVNVSAQAPTGSTGACKDGTYTSAPSKRGACSGHGGVKDWYAAEKPEVPAAVQPPPTPTAKAPTPAAPGGMPTKASTTMPTTAAGGGPGQVWVNTSSHVYHCQSDKWYGKTKKGEYMTETAAKAAGNHADHGKACG